MFPKLLKDAGYYMLKAVKWPMGGYAKGAFDKIVDIYLVG